MAIIEIRDILNNETGETIFPRTHVNAVIGLKDTSFFEAVQDELDPTKFSVKLKSEYTGLWAEGWMAAGGVGSQSGGGGGGLITAVKSVADLGTPIQTESLTETFSAKAIESIFESLGDFGSSLSLSLPSSYFKDANGNYFLDANGNRIITSAGSSCLNLLNKSGQVLSSVELDILTQETDPTVPAWAKQENPYFFIGTTQVQTSSAAQALTGILSIKASSSTSSLMQWDSTNNAWHFYGNVYADGWVSAGGIGSGGGGGGSSSLAGLSDVSLSSPTNGQALVYRSGVWQNETIQGGGGSGSVTSVAMTVPTGLSVSGSPITSSGTLAVSLASGYTIPTTATLDNFVTLDGSQIITGEKTFSSFIDIGNARLVYDQGSNALHITNKSGTQTVGLYADGFIASGGIGGSVGAVIDDAVTQNSANAVKSSGIYSFVTSRRWVGTQAQYNALGTYSNDVEYLITES